MIRTSKEVSATRVSAAQILASFVSHKVALQSSAATTPLNRMILGNLILAKTESKPGRKRYGQDHRASCCLHFIRRSSVDMGRCRRDPGIQHRRYQERAGGTGTKIRKGDRQ